MGIQKEKVVVAMSGGVDSSVAACLLVEQGFDVMGMFMRVGNHGDSPPASPAATGRSHQGCCSAVDAGDARFVAGKLGIPFYALNFEKEFDRIIDYFAEEYSRGRTPNPCVVCNDRLKFGKILEYADAVGAKYIATGHYARIEERSGGRVLMRAKDSQKDQSYVLFGIGRNVLDRVIFPIGDRLKADVRRLAEEWNLPNWDKPDSVEICFAPDRDYARVVRDRRPDAFLEGDVLDVEGGVIGRHRGIGHYTVGQRRGLGIAAGTPIYVTELNVKTNTVTVGDRDELLAVALIGRQLNFLVEPRTSEFRADVKIRYLHQPTAATVYLHKGPEALVVFDEPQRAITPGQAVVFYDEDVVLGGGWIERAVRWPAEGEELQLSLKETAGVKVES